MQILKQLAEWDLDNLFYLSNFEFNTHVHSLDWLELLVQAMLVKTEHTSINGILLKIRLTT